jgi:hypothetical protein
MPDASKPPIVIYCLCNPVGRGRLYVGYLGQLDGIPHCFFDEQMKSPQFSIHEDRLQKLPDTITDREVYLYQPPEDRLQQYART